MCKIEQLFTRNSTADSIEWGIKIILPGQDFGDGRREIAKAGKVREDAITYSKLFPTAVVYVYLGTAAKHHDRFRCVNGELVDIETTLPDELATMCHNLYKAEKDPKVKLAQASMARIKWAN